jgi:hypothetical protein
MAPTKAFGSVQPPRRVRDRSGWVSVGSRQAVTEVHADADFAHRCYPKVDLRSLAAIESGLLSVKNRLYREKWYGLIELNLAVASDEPFF